MPIPLHNHFRWTSAARARIDVVAGEYRAAGLNPRILSLSWGAVLPREGKPFSTPVIGFYCEPEFEQIPAEEIGVIDGVECVFATAEHIKPMFIDKILDWTEQEGWVLRAEPPAA